MPYIIEHVLTANSTYPLLTLNVEPRSVILVSIITHSNMYNINKWIIVVVVLIIVGVLVNKYAPVPGSTNESQTLSQSAFPPQIIEMTKDGFKPDNIVIPVGTVVRFVNSDTSPHWPASGVHPTHELCPGFDAFHPIIQGEFYEFTFREAKICPVHDHLNPSFTGTITVGNFQ